MRLNNRPTLGIRYGETFRWQASQNRAPNSCRNLVLHGQYTKHDLNLSGTKVHFTTADAVVMVVDLIENEYHDSTAWDFYNMACITDTCDKIKQHQKKKLSIELVYLVFDNDTTSECYGNDPFITMAKISS